MKLFVFGSSLTSSYWNGAATYYRGIYKNLHALGHDITFAEPDIYGRQQKRDAGDIDYARILVYQTPRDLDHVLAEAAGADLVIKHSGVGADDEFLERAVLDLQSCSTQVAFWDVDAPATLARVEEDPADPFRSLIPQYDFIFTYGGGPPVVDHYLPAGRAQLPPHLQRARSRLPTIPCRPIPRSPAISPLSAIACPIASSASRNSSCAPPNWLPTCASSSAAKAGQGSGCPPTSAGSATSAPPITTA